MINYDKYISNNYPICEAVIDFVRNRYDGKITIVIDSPSLFFINNNYDRLVFAVHVYDDNVVLHNLDYKIVLKCSEPDVFNKLSEIIDNNVLLA